MQPSSSRGWREDVAWVANVVRQWFANLPLLTKFTFTTLIAVYTLQLLTSDAWAFSLCLRAPAVLHLQVWRIVTSALTHSSLLHLAFNLMALVPLAQSLERTLGTLQLGSIVLALMLTQPLLFITLAYALAATRIDPRATLSCVRGFSSAILGLISIENAHYIADQAPAAAAAGGTPQRSLFGLVSIPASLYPWALLLLWQLLMPNVSFLGHLSGLLTGLLWVHGHLRPLSPLPRATLVALEEAQALRRLVAHPGYVLAPLGSLPTTAPRGVRQGAAATTNRSGPALPWGLAETPSGGAFTHMFSTTTSADRSGHGSTVQGLGSAAEAGPSQQRARDATGNGSSHQSFRAQEEGRREVLSATEEAAIARAAAAAAAEARQKAAAGASAGSSSSQGT